jgi:hypothetical protein
MTGAGLMLSGTRPILFHPQERLAGVLETTTEVLRIAALLLSPIIPVC